MEKLQFDLAEVSPDGSIFNWNKVKNDVASWGDWRRTGRWSKSRTYKKLQEYERFKTASEKESYKDK